jgi:tripartite-type tricarboxylate transporter receptor subunit TctC
MRGPFIAAAVVAAAAAVIMPAPGQAQSDYPNRVVKIVNPYGAGSAPDILVRALVTSLSSQFGQQFIVENRVGGSGAVGTASVVRADPDGYTLLFAPALVLSVLPQARGADAGYKPDSLTSICQTFVVSLVMGTEVGQNIRMIGVFSEKRIATFPDVPTIKEQGYDVTPASFGGLLAPLGTPQPILSKLSSGCAEAAKSDVYVTTAKRAGQPDDYYSDAAAFRLRLSRDIESKARVLARVKTQ